MYALTGVNHNSCNKEKILADFIAALLSSKKEDFIKIKVEFITT